MLAGSVDRTTGRRLRLLAVALAGTIAPAMLTLPGAAQATFPGMNGKIAFERGNETAEHDIYSIDLDGTDELNLTHNGSNNRQIAWSSDGSRIAFFSDGDGSDNYYNIHVAPADGSGPFKIADTGSAESPAWSPDGRTIAFSDESLYTVHPDGTGLRVLAAPRVGIPFWSPDGTRIAFAADYDGAGNIYVVNADGSGLTRLTDDADLAGDWLSWSPDGTRIVYVSGRDSGCSYFSCNRLYVMNADGSDKRGLTEPESFFPTWSPDGSRIAYSAIGRGTFQIFTVKPDGTDVRQVTNSAEGNYGPEWSPDSSQLVFMRSTPPLYQDVRVINGDGTGDRFVAIGGDPQWQPLPFAKHPKRRCKPAPRSRGRRCRESALDR
jgi:Tol biopolymer transport system component